MSVAGADMILYLYYVSTRKLWRQVIDGRALPPAVGVTYY